MAGYESILPTRQYCTEACFLGLKREHDLDEKCPNVSAHLIDNCGSRHAISADELTRMVGEQVYRSAYWYCKAVDPNGSNGKIGRIRALFHLELAPYGYSFVAKDAQSAHLRHLHHESSIYAYLDSLQGFVVPVHLGIIGVALPRGYYVYGGCRVTHMMLLSWGGKLSCDAAADMLIMETEEKRSSKRRTWCGHVS